MRGHEMAYPSSPFGLFTQNDKVGAGRVMNPSEKDIIPLLNICIDGEKKRSFLVVDNIRCRTQL